MAHEREGYISTSVYNLTSPSCYSTPISFKTRKFRRFAYI